MYNKYLGNFLKFAAKLRPMIASLTVFAYVNTFVLPITEAVANPGKDEIIASDAEIKHGSPRSFQVKSDPQLETKSQEGWWISFVNAIISAIHSSHQTDTSEEGQQKHVNFNNITQKTPEQFNFINKLNTLFGYVGEVQSTQAQQERRLVNWKPRLNKVPTLDQKQKFIRHVFVHVLRESQLDVDALEKALKQEKLNKHTLNIVQYLRKDLKDQIETIFDATQQDEVRRALKYLKDFTTQEQKNTQGTIESIKSNLSEGKETHAYIKDTFEELDSDAPLWKAMNQLSKVLPLVNEKLPERVKNAIQKNSLTNVYEEYACNENGPTALLVSLLDKVTSPMATKALIVFAGLNFLPVAAAVAVALPLPGVGRVDLICPDDNCNRKESTSSDNKIVINLDTAARDQRVITQNERSLGSTLETLDYHLNAPHRTNVYILPEIWRRNPQASELWAGVIHERAEGGDVQALYALSQMYKRGQGVMQNLKKSEYYWVSAYRKECQEQERIEKKKKKKKKRIIKDSRDSEDLEATAYGSNGPGFPPRLSRNPTTTTPKDGSGGNSGGGYKNTNSSINRE